MLKTVTDKAVFYFNKRLINPLAVESVTRRHQKWIGGPDIWEAIMQKRLGLDLEVSDEFGHWLAGFTDGEAHFKAIIVINQNGNRQLEMSFNIKLRADDKPLLMMIHITLGVGSLFDQPSRPPTKPQIIYRVSRTADLYHIIVPLFEKHPLLSKKARDFEIWKELVHIAYHAQRNRGSYGRRGKGRHPHSQSYWGKVEPLVKQLKQGRKFSP